MCDNSTKHTSENGDGMEKEELLQRVFGYSSFRPGQEKLIDGVLSGQDGFGILIQPDTYDPKCGLSTEAEDAFLMI